MSSRWYYHDCKKEWLGDEDGDNDEGALAIYRETIHRENHTLKEKQNLKILVRRTSWPSKDIALLMKIFGIHFRGSELVGIDCNFDLTVIDIEFEYIF